MVGANEVRVLSEGSGIFYNKFKREELVNGKSRYSEFNVVRI